jgi:tetratricopeptide (TPR) repeat protein
MKKNEISVDYYNIGNEFHNNKQYKKAIEMYEKSIKYNPKNNQAILNLVLSYQMDKQYDQVEILIRKHYTKKISDFDKKLLSTLGNNYYLIGSYQKALSTYMLYITDYENEPDGYFNMGLCYQKLGDVKSSISYFTKAYEKNEKFIPALYNIANYHYTQDEFEESRKFYKKLVALETNNPDLYYRLGLLEKNALQYKEAKGYFEKAINITKDNPEYYIELAKIYAKGYSDKKLTLENLNKAFEYEYKEFDKILSSEEFIVLKETKEFAELIKKYKF